MSLTTSERLPETQVDVICGDSGVFAKTNARRRRPGPEADLVDWFLEAWPLITPDGCRVTAFREPRIESGFPDLVLVVWDVIAAKRWNPLRAQLTKLDFRLMQFLINEDTSSYENLVNVFSRRVNRHLARLEASEMVYEENGCWKAKCLSNIFAARHIVAIEAKMTHWTAALEQATLNTWFASMSNVLFPSIPKCESFLRSAHSRGIGIWTQSDCTERKLMPESSRLPISYASWLFNEWTCQHAQASR